MTLADIAAVAKERERTRDLLFWIGLQALTWAQSGVNGAISWEIIKAHINALPCGGVGYQA